MDGTGVVFNPVVSPFQLFSFATFLHSQDSAFLLIMRSFQCPFRNIVQAANPWTELGKRCAYYFIL